MRVDAARRLRAFILLAPMSISLHCSPTSAPSNASPAGRPGKGDLARRDPEGPHWVGTWANAPQLVEASNLPEAPGLSGSTLRQLAYVSIGGTELRVRLSNAYGDGPVTMAAVHLAASRGADAIDPTSDRALSFHGSASVTIPPGQTALSDPFAYPLKALDTVALTIAFGAAPAAVTGHPGSRTHSYLVAGSRASAPSLPSSTAVPHWYYATGIDVVSEASGASVVTLGDSITDGRGSTTDGNDRWPDELSRRLRENERTRNVGVLNQGIGGNAVLRGGLGPTASQRFERDVLAQSGARWVVILEGVNDIGASTGEGVAKEIVAAFGRFIDAAHAHGMRAYGSPILPFGGSAYASGDHERSRQAVNAWIRTSGRFDAVVDLDAAVRDPARPAYLASAYDSGDGLHLSPAGYRAMADAFDLALFSP